MYDIQCDRWIPANDRVPKDLDADLARFGHTAVVHNGSMVVHGGFHGLLRNDVLSYTPGSCESFKTRRTCLAAKVGVKCAFDVKKDSCVRLSSEAAGGAEVAAATSPSKSGVLQFCSVDGGGAAQANNTEACAKIKSCTSCVSTSLGCVWCGDKKCRWRGCGAESILTKSGDSGVAVSPRWADHCLVWLHVRTLTNMNFSLQSPGAQLCSQACGEGADHPGPVRGEQPAHLLEGVVQVPALLPLLRHPPGVQVGQGQDQQVQGGQQGKVTPAVGEEQAAGRPGARGLGAEWRRRSG